MTELLRLDSVTVRRGQKVVLENLDFSLNSSEILVIRGSNGSGKSTLVESICGLLRLESGSAFAYEQLIRDSEGRRKLPVHPIGLTLQDNGLIESMTIREHLEYASSQYNSSLSSDIFFEVLEIFKLSHRIDDLILKLSGGQKRKLSVLTGLLCGMVCADRRAIILDEPDSGLDDESIETLCNVLIQLKERGHGILISSHNTKFLEICNRIFSFDDRSYAEFDGKDGEKWKVVGKSYPRNQFLISMKTGFSINAKTLASLGSNVVSALFVIFLLTLIFDQNQFANLTNSQRIILLLCPAFAAGNIGDPTVRILSEGRSWQRISANNLLPNDIITPLIVGGSVTLLALFAMNSMTLSAWILVGSLTTLCFSQLSRAIEVFLLRLARPRAVMFRILLPFVALPYVIILETLLDII